MNSTKILIVEDDSSSRFILRKLLNHKGYTVETAVNGKEAFELFSQKRFDVVIADWLMPEMDGIELTKKIRESFEKQPIIFILTAIAIKEAKVKALNSGADEFIAKPLNSDAIFALLENTIQKDKSSVKIPVKKEVKIIKRNFHCVAIAASTGGPPTLQKFFRNLDYCNAAFMIVQHGPQWMLETFAENIAKITPMKVQLGASGETIAPGNIYIAPGGKHMSLLKGELQIELSEGEPVNFVKPSADPLFKSVAFSFGAMSVGVVFTGMGKDGSVGAGFIRAAGGKIFAEDPATATLPSMPQSVISLGLADEIENAENIACKLNSLFSVKNN